MLSLLLSVGLGQARSVQLDGKADDGWVDLASGETQVKILLSFISKFL